MGSTRLADDVLHHLDVDRVNLMWEEVENVTVDQATWLMSAVSRGTAATICGGQS